VGRAGFARLLGLGILAGIVRCLNYLAHADVPTIMIELNDSRIDKLIGLIQDSFRTRPNHDPVYVDIGGNLERVRASQHQVIFGRRGSGKTCLLVHFANRAAEAGILTIYIDADEIKRLGYPDVLIRLLLNLTEQLPGKRRGALAKRFPWLRPTALEAQAGELRGLLDMAEASDVVAEQHRTSNRETGASIGRDGASAKFGKTEGTGEDRTSTFKERKLETLERHLQDYKRVIQEAFRATGMKSGAVIIDDFYLFHRDIQPDIADYIHRLLRGTAIYLKLGTIRHRTRLVRQDGQTIGFELRQDVEEISLDRTFEDVAPTEEFLKHMLDSLAGQVGISSASEFISAEGFQALTLASGGVPRDYLSILVDGIESARSSGFRRVTPKSIYKGAARNSYRTKLKNLREDADRDSGAIERVFQDLAKFCLVEEKKTGFLVSQDEVSGHEAEREILQQLMDFKLIHVLEPDTSAASSRTGRYEAYTLDFALFMEPRRRNISRIEFWKRDSQRQRAGVREAPTYPLARVRDLLSGEVDADASSESILESIEQEAHSSDTDDTDEA
jgi:hypothetical protein